MNKKMLKAATYLCLLAASASVGFSLRSNGGRWWRQAIASGLAA